MDYSENSGSLQSSSGGDEEYDSGFISNHHNPSASHFGFASEPNNAATMFDPLPATYFDQHLQNNPPAAFRSTTPNTSFTFTQLPQASTVNATSSSSSAPAGVIAPRSSASTKDHQATHAVRNPKKRTRASRRAPTTVLTTDTSNFRAMVQEFTGIPAPPFTSPSFQARTRFDLFASPSSAMRSNNPLVRPFPQKPQLSNPPFLSSSYSSSLALNSSSELDYALGLNSTTMQSFNLFDMQNPMLTSSLLQYNSPLNVALPSLIPSDHVQPMNQNNQATWRDGAGPGADEARQSVPVPSPRGMDNIAAAAAARNEGMLETWISSSD